MALRLKYWRTRRALSIDDLAARAGMSTQTIVNLEKDRQPARPRTIQKLADALAINVDDLLEVEETNQNLDTLELDRGTPTPTWTEEELAEVLDRLENKHVRSNEEARAIFADFRETLRKKYNNNSGSKVRTSV